MIVYGTLKGGECGGILYRGDSSTPHMVTDVQGGESTTILPFKASGQMTGKEYPSSGESREKRLVTP